MKNYLIIFLVFCSCKIWGQTISYQKVNYQLADSSKFKVNNYETGSNFGGYDSIIGLKISIDYMNGNEWSNPAYIILCDSAFDDSLNINLDVMTSGLSTGKHYIYISTIDRKGRISIPAVSEFYITSKVISGEYFIDTDPGIRNGNLFNINSPGDSVSEDLSGISSAGLEPGLHTLYVRTFSDNGSVSAVSSRNFFITSNVIRGEYFTDNDPGVGNGTAFQINSPSDSVDKSLQFTPNLSPGFHSVFVRTQSNNGSWSLVSRRDFYITSALSAAEYFFDSDPGAGNGIALNIPTSDSIAENFQINTTGLGTGTHQVFIRTRDQQGAWSLYSSRQFYIQPRIKAYRYWIDTIPNFSNGVTIEIPSNIWADSLVMNGVVSLACIDTGTHYLWVSTQDENGYWGSLMYDTFRVVPGNAIGLNHYIPGPGPAGTPVKLQGTGGGGANYRYRDVTHGGNFQTDNRFIIPNDSAVVFQVRDTCGNYAIDTIQSLPLPVEIAKDGGTSKTILYGTNTWVYICDSAGKLISSINDQGQNLDTVSVSYYLHQGNVRKEPTNNWSYLNRNWMINATNQPNAVVGLRLYWLKSEFDTLNLYDHRIDSLQQCQITKYSGPNQNLNMNDNSFGGSYSSVLFPNWGTFNYTDTGHFAEVTISGFSEFYLGNGGLVPLPVQWIDLKGEKGDLMNKISWNVVGEKAVRNYHLERHVTGKNPEVIYITPAKNLGTVSYSYNDSFTENESIYYRVSAEDETGKTTESEWVLVTGDDKYRKHSFSIFPNPSNGNITISCSRPGDYNLEIYDPSGKIIRSLSVLSQKDFQLNMSDLAQGLYYIKIYNQLDHSSQFIPLQIIK